MSETQVLRVKAGQMLLGTTMHTSITCQRVQIIHILLVEEDKGVYGQLNTLVRSMYLTVNFELEATTTPSNIDTFLHNSVYMS